MCEILEMLIVDNFTLTLNHPKALVGKTHKIVHLPRFARSSNSPRVEFGQLSMGCFGYVLRNERRRNWGAVLAFWGECTAGAVTLTRL